MGWIAAIGGARNNPTYNADVNDTTHEEMWFSVKTSYDGNNPPICTCSQDQQQGIN